MDLKHVPTDKRPRNSNQTNAPRNTIVTPPARIFEIGEDKLDSTPGWEIDQWDNEHEEKTDV